MSGPFVDMQNSRTPKTNLNTVLALYFRKVGFRIREVLGIESEGTPS